MTRIAAWVTWPLRWFAAPDLFISYARRDARAYAESLAEQLSRPPLRLSVSIDLLVSLPDRRTPARVLRSARWSRARVVVVTPAALGSREIEKELAEFAHYPGPVVTVVEPGTLVHEALWHAHVIGVDAVPEAGGRPAFEAGRPSEAVLARVGKVVGFLKRERRVTLAATVGAVVTVLGAALGALFGVQAERAAGRALQAEGQAASARATATSANERAASAAREAALAESRASAATTRASEAGRLADAEAARALAFQRQGEATRLAADAANLLQTQPARMTEALELVHRSLEATPTAAGEAVARQMLGSLPSLKASARTEHEHAC